MRDVAQNLVSDPAYVTGLRQRLQRGKAPHMEPVLWYYAWGKPKETTEMQGTLRIVWEQ